MQEKSENKTIYKLIYYLLIGSAFSSLIIYMIYLNNYFFSDDFVLISDSINKATIFKPISSHLRPVVRVHFMIINEFFLNSSFIAHLFSLMLHVFASLSLWLFLRNKFSSKVAIISSLLFLSSFRHNEAVFWVSAIGVIYCFLFVFLSLYFYEKEKNLMAVMFLLLSMFSYELWLLLPFAFLLLKKNKKIIYLSFIFSVSYIFLIFKNHYINTYGGFSFRKFPNKFSYFITATFSPFSLSSENFLSYIILLIFVGIAIFFILKKKNNSILILSIYFIPALIYSFSEYLPSRFFYFPTVLVYIMISIFFVIKKKYFKIVSSLILLYFIILNPIILYVDGKDYKNFSHLYKKIIVSGEKNLRNLKPNEKISLIVAIPPNLLFNFLKIIKGTPKVFFYRGKFSVGGLIYVKDYVTFILNKFSKRHKKIECNGSMKVMQIGHYYPVYRYCFRVL